MVVSEQGHFNLEIRRGTALVKHSSGDFSCSLVLLGQLPTMDSFMLQDDGVRDRIRQAEEFLVPSKNEWCYLLNFCIR